VRDLGEVLRRSDGSLEAAGSLVTGAAFAAAAASLALAGMTAALAGVDRQGSVVTLLPAVIGFALAGSVVMWRRHDHPIGPLLCLTGLAVAIPAAASSYARHTLIFSPRSFPFGKQAAWVSGWSYAPAVGLAVFVLPQVFPDGRLLSARWRPALWAALAFIPLAVVGNAFVPQKLGIEGANLANPYGVASAKPLFWGIQLLAGLSSLIAVPATLASVVVRWKRSGPVGRQQLKWFLASVAIVIASTLVYDVFPGNGLSLALVVVGLGLMPVAIGVAVLRYRLYEIDVLLHRAALYGSLSAAVAGCYLAAVALARGVFGLERSLAVQVVSTVVAAAVLWPLRDRVQRGVDRLFYGDRGTPYDAMARLGRRVEEASSADSALGSVAQQVAQSLRLPYTAIELRAGAGWVQAAHWGVPPVDLVAFPLVAHAENVGRLLVGLRAPGEQLGPEEERLLGDLARQVGPAAQAVSLRADLEASRAAMVTGREEERRRLRRDLHDGLGPTLAGLTLGLDTARLLCPAPDLEELLVKLKAETQRAVSDVRRIVYGLRPPALDELGLAGALREEVARLELQAPGLSVSLITPEGRLDGLPAAVEVAGYRIVCEALTNVVRHAQARRCSVRVDLDDSLALQVCDDGVGLPDGWRAGVGVTAMRERVAELAGELIVEAMDPRGTRIAARLPLGAVE
jgi:signal transduction histidine kinase